MALKKQCRCGKIIDYSMKYCEECEAKVKDIKKESNQYYDKNIRNKDSTSVYHSVQWNRLTEQCKNRFKGLDIYSYYVLGEIEYGSLCHHIEEITMNDKRKYDLENLIYLTSSNHNMIHGLYKKDCQGTMEILFELVTRWKKEFGI